MKKKKCEIPTGLELLQYLNDGYAICNDCGAIMDMDDERDMYVCPNCGSEVDHMEEFYGI